MTYAPLCFALLLATPAWAQDEPAPPADEPPPVEEPAPPVEEAPPPVEEAPPPVEEVAQEAEESDGIGLTFGVHLGAAIPVTRLKTAFVPRIELGYRLPVLDRAIGINVSLAYSRHNSQGEESDDRVPNGTWTWELKQDVLILAPGLSFRYPKGFGPVVPELILAPQIVFLRSKVDGEAGGSPFGESSEQFARPGFYASLGGAIEAGPGEVVISVYFSTSALDGDISGASQTAAVGITAGYRFVF